MSKTADNAVGRWHSILTGIGFPAEALVNKHGPCPLGCGGKKSFRFDDKERRGTWICSHCGAGEGVELVKQFLQCDARAALKRIDELLPQAIETKAAPEKDYTDVKRTMNKLWGEAYPIGDIGGPVAQYLKRRLGFIQPDTGLRCHTGVDYYDADRTKVGRFPAMLASVLSIHGAFVGLHRTYLTYDGGEKAPVDAPKKLMTCVESIAGCAIRLARADGAVLGVAEGIETALAASRRFVTPVWATISTSGMESFVPPDNVRHVDIYADHDTNGAGQLSAYKLMNKLVLKYKISAAVHIPHRPGTDWADPQ